MEEQEEKIGVWNLPEPTDAEEIAYLRHANALLRESIQHQSQLFDNVKAAVMLLDSTKANLAGHLDDNEVVSRTESHELIRLLDDVVIDIEHIMLLLGGV